MLRHASTETDIDISLGILLFEQEMVERASTQSFSNLSIRLPTPEDLIIMKAIARRPKDLEDIRTIAGKYPNLDRKRIEQWVTSFGEVLELPDLWTRSKPCSKKIHISGCQTVLAVDILFIACMERHPNHR